jgi:drug/metabolite transporter (DMT)-like permease
MTEDKPSQSLNISVGIAPFSSQPSHQSPTLTALFFLFIALLALSLAAIFIRLGELDLGSNATVFNRLWISTLFFSVWNSIQHIKTQKEPDGSPEHLKHNDLQRTRNIVLLILMSIASSISVLLWAWSLTQTSVANSTALRNSTPIFTTLFGWLLIGKKFKPVFLIGMAIAFFGAVAIGIADFSFSMDHMVGDVAALLAAMFYSIYLLIIEKLRVRFSTSTILLWRCAVGTVFTLPFVLLTKEQIFPHTVPGWASVLALALVCQVLGQGLLAQSLNQLSSSFVATTLLLEPAIAAFIAWILFSEQLTLLNGLAFCIILLGIYLAQPSKLSTATEENNAE